MGSIDIGVLAIQGDYQMHIEALERMDVPGAKGPSPPRPGGDPGLIIPGGESTTMVKLAKDYGLFEELRRAGNGGLPMFGTCAGAILLGRGDAYPERLGLVPVNVRRNAYGRQRESFERPVRLGIVLPANGCGGVREFTCVFIRAPKIDPPDDPEVEVLARDGEDPILLRYRNYLLATFHPELTADGGIHRLFLEMCRK